MNERETHERDLIKEYSQLMTRFRSFFILVLFSPSVGSFGSRIPVETQSKHSSYPNLCLSVHSSITLIVDMQFCWSDASSTGRRDDRDADSFAELFCFASCRFL